MKSPLRQTVLNDAHRGILAALRDTPGFDAVADIVASYARIVLGAEGASVTRREGEAYVYVATAGAPVPAVGCARPLAGSFTGRVMAQRRAQFFRARAEPDSAERAARDGIGSGIVAPILHDGVAIGTVGVASAGFDTFDDEDLDDLVGFSEYLSLSLILCPERAQAPPPLPVAGVLASLDEHIGALRRAQLDPASASHVAAAEALVDRLRHLVASGSGR